MKALCWHGHGDVRVDTVPDPRIQEPTDVIIKRYLKPLLSKIEAGLIDPSS